MSGSQPSQTARRLAAGIEGHDESMERSGGGFLGGEGGGPGFDQGVELEEGEISLRVGGDEGGGGPAAVVDGDGDGHLAGGFVDVAWDEEVVVVVEDDADTVGGEAVEAEDNEMLCGLSAGLGMGRRGGCGADFGGGERCAGVSTLHFGEAGELLWIELAGPFGEGIAFRGRGEVGGQGEAGRERCLGRFV